MKVKSFLIGAVALSLAAVVYAQTSQTSQSSSQSQSGNGRTSVWGSASSSSSGSASAGGFRNGSAGGSHSGSGGGSANGSGSGFGINGKPTHAILYTLESSSPESDASGVAFDQHTKHLSDQQAKGKVLLFGPWRDLPGSMAIVVAKSDEEANEIAKNDPAVKSGALTFEVRAWSVMAPTAQSNTQKAGTRTRN